MTVKFSNFDVLEVELNHEHNRLYRLNGKLKTAKIVKVCNGSDKRVDDVTGVLEGKGIAALSSTVNHSAITCHQTGRQEQ